MENGSKLKGVLDRKGVEASYKHLWGVCGGGGGRGWGAELTAV